MEVAGEEINETTTEKPLHPFKADGYYDLTCEWRSEKFWYGVALVITSTIVHILLLAYQLRTNLTDCVLAIIIAWCLQNICFYWHTRKLTISPLDNVYIFRIGADLIHKSIYRNLYVRLRRQTNTAMADYHWLIIGGCGVESLELTGISKNPVNLEHLGKKIARHTNLNFFHCDDVSNKHVVRHSVEAPETCVDEEVEPPVDIRVDEATMSEAEVACIDEQMNHAASSKCSINEQRNHHYHQHAHVEIIVEEASDENITPQ